MEIRRFGPGYRRREGMPGTRGVSGQGIHSDARGNIAELVFRPHAVVSPHSNPNTTYFVVIEGGGFVQVGDEQARVAAGEAILWPANVVHGAWTDLTPMRALVVEFAGSGEAPALLVEGAPIEHFVEAVPDGTVSSINSGGSASALAADGSLAARPAPPHGVLPDEEPW